MLVMDIKPKASTINYTRPVIPLILWTYLIEHLTSVNVVIFISNHEIFYWEEPNTQPPQFQPI